MSSRSALAEVLSGVLVGVDLQDEGWLAEEKTKMVGGLQFRLQRIVAIDDEIRGNERESRLRLDLIAEKLTDRPSPASSLQPPVSEHAR